MRHLALPAALSLILSVLIAVEPAGAQLPLKCNGSLVTISGTQEADRIVGTPGDDVIHGLGGNDVIHGMGGNDVICGGTGRDRILGGSGSDRILGNEGRDKVRGGPGRDTLFGGDSHDRLSGGPGADRIDGGNGNDLLKGGKGDDSLDGKGGFDRCVGDSGLDGSGRCEEALTDLQAWTVAVGGASVYIVASEPSLTGITEITESGWIVEQLGLPQLCQEFTWFLGEVQSVSVLSSPDLSTTAGRTRASSESRREQSPSHGLPRTACPTLFAIESGAWCMGT